MDAKQRVQRCRLLEKMKLYQVYSKRLGLEDVSTIHGKRIDECAKGIAKKG